jgi:hypothetical protein
LRIIAGLLFMLASSYLRDDRDLERVSSGAQPSQTNNLYQPPKRASASLIVLGMHFWAVSKLSAILPLLLSKRHKEPNCEAVPKFI